MSKYTWYDMELCKQCECHFADKDNPDICHAFGEPKEKPGPMTVHSGCSRYLRESKYQRTSKEH